MNDGEKKVRVSNRIQEFLSGGQVWADLENKGEAQAKDREQTPGNVSMHEKVMGAPSRKDGSVTVALTFDEARSLYSYAGALHAGARDNVGWAPEDNLPDLRATSALMRKLETLFGYEVAR
jgi:hypothetical protein